MESRLSEGSDANPLVEALAELLLHRQRVQVDGSLPDFTDVVVHAWFLHFSLSVNWEFGVKPLCGGTTMELLEFHVESWSFPTSAIRVAVVEAESALDVVGFGHSLLEVAERVGDFVDFGCFVKVSKCNFQGSLVVGHSLGNGLFWVVVDAEGAVEWRLSIEHRVFVVHELRVRSDPLTGVFDAPRHADVLWLVDGVLPVPFTALVEGISLGFDGLLALLPVVVVGLDFVGVGRRVEGAPWTVSQIVR